MLMVGQPGSGKSLTMRELAGWTATDPDAPTPVPVHLPDLLPLHIDHAVTTEDLVRLAAKRGPRSGVEQVERFLIRAIEEGDAVLLLDGLDECRDRAAWMADRLRTLIANLHPLTAVVVATRGSAVVPAERIGLPRVDLRRPGNLDATIDAVLTQCADVRIPEPEHRTEWLQIRRDWLEDARNNQAGMLQVPQLALLLTLIIGSTVELEVPKKRAELLHAAVRESVKRWEHDRFSGTLSGTWAHDLTPEMLIDGFVGLGRLLEDRVPPPSHTDALAALADMLVDSDRWNLARAKAREIAVQVLTFWDTHVAVFVLDEEDRLTSRSRVFTEVATAMWTKTCTPEALREWGTEAIRYYDSEGVVVLALGLNPDLVALLLQIGESITEATLAVAAAVEAGAIDLNVDQFASLLAQLGRHASEIESGAKKFPERQTRDERPFFKWLVASRHSGPTSWPLIEVLCRLDLDKEQRQQRDHLLAGVALKAPHTVTVAAWIALADAETDARPLADDEVEVVAAALARGLPPTGSMVKVDGVHTFTGGGPSDPGLGDVAQRAVQFLSQLPESAPEQIYLISDHIPHQDAYALRTSLAQEGVDTSQWAAPSPITGYINSRLERDFETRLLEDVASFGDASTPLDKNDRWSLPHISDLIDATGYEGISHPDFIAAFDPDDAELRRSWLRALGNAYGIDLNRAAAEAAVALAEPLDAFATPPGWWLISHGRFDPIELPDQSTLSAADQQALLECMHAQSHWIAHPSLYILANATPTWDTVEFFGIDRSTWPPYRASECYLLGLLVSSEGPHLAQQAIASAEPARRHALGRALKFRRELDQTGEFATRLGADEDMWVREGHDAGEPTAVHWTCRWCGQRNDPNKGSCSKCELSSRPVPKHDEEKN